MKFPESELEIEGVIWLSYTPDVAFRWVTWVVRYRTAKYAYKRKQWYLTRISGKIREKCVQTSGCSNCAQMYTILADCDSLREETKVHPVIFALPPEEHIRLFHLNLDSVPEWNHQQIDLDFEVSAISAI